MKDFQRCEQPFSKASAAGLLPGLYCLDERWEKFGNERRYGLKHPPSYYFRRQCFLSVDPDEELVVDTIKALGDENIVISTDWPHGDSSFPQALNTFLKIDGVSGSVPAQ